VVALGYVDYDPFGWHVVSGFVKHLGRYGVEGRGDAGIEGRAGALESVTGWSGQARSVRRPGPPVTCTGVTGAGTTAMYRSRGE